MAYTPSPEEDWRGFFDADGNFTGQELSGPYTGTDYYILEREGPRHHYMVRDGKYAITRHLMIRDADLSNFMTDFGGGYDWTVDGACTTYLPASYPGMSWMIVSDIDAVPSGDRDFMLGWDENGAALVLFRDVTVLYEVKDFLTHDDDESVPEGTTLQIHTDFSTSAALFPTNGLSWAPNPSTDYVQPLQENVNVVAFESNSTLDLMWKFVPIPNWPAIGTYAGYVNDKKFFGYPPGTVMYLGAQAEATFTVNATQVLWKITFKFQTKMVPIQLVEASDAGVGGWSYFLNPGPKSDSGATPAAPEYQQINYNGTNDAVFPAVNMLELFFVGGGDSNGQSSLNVNEGQVGTLAQDNTEIQLLTNDPELLSVAPYPP
jgi:hypothetical protein